MRKWHRPFRVVRSDRPNKGVKPRWFEEVEHGMQMRHLNKYNKPWALSTEKSRGLTRDFQGITTSKNKIFGWCKKLKWKFQHNLLHEVREILKLFLLSCCLYNQSFLCYLLSLAYSGTEVALSTHCYSVVTHLSTKQSHHCFTLEIYWESVTWP